MRIATPAGCFGPLRRHGAGVECERVMVERPRRHATEPASPYALDRDAVRRHFTRAATTYDGAAVLQRRVADQLIERLDVVRLKPERILDAGCGTGYCARMLARRYRRARVVGLDLAPAMAARARAAAGWFSRTRYAAGDAERLPFAHGVFDMVVSNFMLPWCDPPAVFAECLRVLRPEGLLVFTSLGPDTLEELRRAWERADGAAHVHTFLDMHDVGDALVHAGFAEPVMDVERYTLTYADAYAVMRDLKALGAQNALRGRPRGLTGRARFERARASYDATAAEGRVAATCEVVYGHAWAPRGPATGRPVIRIRSA